MKTGIVKDCKICSCGYDFIEKMCSKHYLFGDIRNDNKTNVMTEERKKVLEDVLIMFNKHFTMRGYDIG